MNPMHMYLNCKMASTSSNKIKLVQEFKEYRDGEQDQKGTMHRVIFRVQIFANYTNFPSIAKFYFVKFYFVKICTTCMRMRNRIVDVMHGRGFKFRIHKYLFRKFFSFANSQNKVKYKFPGLRYLLELKSFSAAFPAKWS